MSVVVHRQPNSPVFTYYCKFGDTHANLVQHSTSGETEQHYLRLLNGNCSRGESTPGQYIKIVE